MQIGDDIFRQNNMIANEMPFFLLNLLALRLLRFSFQNFAARHSNKNTDKNDREISIFLERALIASCAQNAPIVNNIQSPKKQPHTAIKEVL